MTRLVVKIFIIFEALVGLTCITANTLPSWVQKLCKVSDSECMAGRVVEYALIFAKGVPELGVEPIDPMKIPTVDVSRPGFQLTFKEGILTGLKNFKLNSYKISPDGKKMTIDVVANVTLKNQYKLDAQILIIPIKGEGAGKYKLKDLNIIIDANMDKFTKNNVTYHGIINYKYTFKVKLATFNLDGLFGGNSPVLAEIALKFLNDNWEGFVYDVAKPLVDTIVDQALTAIKSFAYAIPYADLYLQ